MTTLLRVNDQNTTKIWSQSSMRTKRGLGTILWAIDENMSTNLQAFYNFFNSGMALYNRTGCNTVRAGRSALRNMPSWNTAHSVGGVNVARHSSSSANQLVFSFLLLANYDLWSTHGHWSLAPIIVLYAARVVWLLRRFIVASWKAAGRSGCWTTSWALLKFCMHADIYYHRVIAWRYTPGSVWL